MRSDDIVSALHKMAVMPRPTTGFTLRMLIQVLEEPLTTQDGVFYREHEAKQNNTTDELIKAVTDALTVPNLATYAVTHASDTSLSADAIKTVLCDIMRTTRQA
jgi:hypothetical protein